jgi:Plasmid encoded RepA protein
VHAGFALTALPHCRITETEWVRETAGLTLRVESGKDERGTVVGIPYGSVARMILLYLQTEAVRTRSREVELGRSMNRRRAPPPFPSSAPLGWPRRFAGRGALRCRLRRAVAVGR